MIPRFDLNAPAVIADPYPHYAWLREHAPVYHSIEHDLWIVSRHDDVVTAVRDHGRFSSDLGGLSFEADPFNPTMTSPPWLNRLLERLPAVRVLLTSDPPDHTILRRKVGSAFTPKRLAAWEPRIRQVAERLAEEMARSDRPADLVRDLASPLPTTIIAEMMGIPPRRHKDFKRLSDDLINGLLTGGSRAKLVSSAIAIAWFFARTVRRRRRRPGDDLVSLLVTGDGEQALSLVEQINFCVLLLVAGNETTTNLIANAMLAMFDRPEVWRQVQADPTLAAAVVEETLRFDGPGQGLLRVATTDVTLSGVTIPAGAQVLPLIGSANRDPGHWADADDFQLDRPNGSDHIAFGTGIHFCIGHMLARIEGRVAIETLARRLPHLAPAGEPTRLESPVLRGLRSQPVRTASEIPAVRQEATGRAARTSRSAWPRCPRHFSPRPRKAAATHNEG